MLIDTHCHINMMIKKNFDVLLTHDQIPRAQSIIQEAAKIGVERIINVGTSLPESINCITLAQHFASCYAAIGLHPNDCTEKWKNDLAELKKLLKDKEKNKIIAIGECGLDKHYPNYNLSRQKDAFKAQIELGLQYELPLIIHTRDAANETLRALDDFSKEPLKGVIHCFSENQSFADEVIQRNFVLGIGGTITYSANELLRTIVTNISLEKIILETDAPFLPPQIIRGKENHPKYIATIAEFIAQLRATSLETIAKQTTANVAALFGNNN